MNNPIIDLYHHILHCGHYNDMIHIIKLTFIPNYFESHWLLLLLVKPSPLDTLFIADEHLDSHKRKTILICLDSASTSILLKGTKHIMLWLNHTTYNYNMINIADKLNFGNMILVEPNILYWNNSFSSLLFLLNNEYSPSNQVKNAQG